MIAKLLQDQLGVSFDEIKKTGEKLGADAAKAAADIAEIKAKQDQIIFMLDYITDKIGDK